MKRIRILPAGIFQRWFPKDIEKREIFKRVNRNFVVETQIYNLFLDTSGVRIFRRICIKNRKTDILNDRK